MLCFEAAAVSEDMTDQVRQVVYEVKERNQGGFDCAPESGAAPGEQSSKDINIIIRWPVLMRRENTDLLSPNGLMA